MTRLYRKIFIVSISTLFFPWAAIAQTDAGKLSVDEIIRRAVAAEKAQKKISGRYTYLQHLTKEELDDKGNVTETEKQIIKAVPVEGTQYDRLIEKNGKPLSGDDLEEEQEKENKFLEDLKKNKGKNKDKEEGSFEFDDKFVSKYNFTLRGEQTLNERPAYVIDYKPKSADLPEEDMQDRFLNRTEGTLWIDKQDLVIAKANTRLLEPVKVLGGIAAKVNSMDFTVVLKKNGSEWFPASVNQSVSGRKLVSSFNTRVNVSFDSFEKKSD